MANVYYRTFIIMAVIGIASLGYNANHGSSLFTHSYNSSHTQEGVLSHNLGEDLVFNYTDSFSESTFQLSLTSLNLTYHNELNISFLVEGDSSTSAGISITFNFDTIAVNLTVERYFQDNQVHSLTQGFFVGEPIVKDFIVNIIISGEAGFGKSGSITVYATSFISNIPMIDLSEEEKILFITPDNLLFEGVTFGTKEVTVLTVISNSFNDSYNLELTLDFLVNDFQSFTKEVILTTNSTELARSNFADNQINNLDFQLEIEQGYFPLYITFHVEISSDLIEISNIQLSAKTIQITPNQDTFYEANWIDGIDENIDISSFKPQSALSEQILNISFYSSFEGSIIYSGIAFEVIQGSTLLAYGSITTNKQNGEIQLIIIDTYTLNYQDDLFINFQADASGSGTIKIYSSTTIEIRNILHVDTEIHQMQFEESLVIETPSYGSIALLFYDVIFIENASVEYRNDFLMEFSVSDYNFDSLTLTCYVNDLATYTKTFRNPGDVHVSEEITFTEGINELNYILIILGGGSEITIENMRYSLQQITGSENGVLPAGGIDIPFFQLPKNIFLGLFVLFDCWLVMGIMLRIYKGRKLRKSRQTENDEFILEIAQMSQDY
ncbi:MAG: hypothetical protein E3J43_09030 [Candidatus Heimdallarchaeota archaeon]|nr:MAG: hypothetical protein E3J43_09030 [Candidatus Heimdallarchaeota archaeon]